MADFDEVVGGVLGSGNPLKPTIEEVDEGEFESPIHAVPSATSAHAIYRRMRDSHKKRAFTYARIQGMIDGNPPYDKRQLAKAGLQTQSNVNWRDAEAIYESVALAYWSLFNDVQFVAQFQTNIADPNANPEIGRIASEEFDKILRSWPEFASLMNDHQSDLVKFGISTLIWPDERDWRFNVADVWRFLAPEGTRNAVNAITLCAVEHTMSAQELWDEMEHGGEGSNWDHDALGQMLIQVASFGEDQKNPYSTQYCAEIQRKIRNGDLELDQLYSDDILLVSMYFQEYDGKITRVIFHPNLESSSEFLFISDRQYDSMDQALQVFTFTPGEKFLHGSKGLGHRIFNSIEGITQIDNSLMDGIRRSSTVLIKNKSTRNKDLKKNIYYHGGFVDIGEAEVAQNLMGSNLNSQVEGARYFRNKVEINNNISGASMRSPDGKPATLGEAQIQVTKEAKVQKSRIAHYYEQLDFLLREIVRKMLVSKESWPGNELVQLWKERSIARGVPEEFFALSSENEGLNGLPEHMEVCAVRASGSGSQTADIIETQAMMGLLPAMGERGRIQILKDRVAALRGYRFVERYMPPEDRDEQPTADDTISSIENNQLEKGELVIVSPDNNHAVHANRHMGRMQQLAQAFNQAVEQAGNSGSQSPEVDAEQFGEYSLEEIDIAFQTLGPHFTRHLLFLQQDPTRRELMQSLVAKWNVLANFGDKIANNAQEHRRAKIRELQKQQEELAQLPMEEKLKMAQIESDARVKLAKVQSDAARAGRRDQLRFVLDRQKISFENELKRAKVFGELSLKGGEQAESRRDERRREQGAIL